MIVIGATGTGKSYLGAALAEGACRRGYRALRVRVPRLLGELAIARADGSYSATLNRLAKLDVLVLDDLLIAPLKDSERRDLLEVLEDRYDRCSTVVTSQVPTKTWHEMLGGPHPRRRHLRPARPQRTRCCAEGAVNQEEERDRREEHGRREEVKG